MIREYWNLIGWEPFFSITWELNFSQAYSFPRMLMNHKNFHFTQTPDKTNDVILLKSPKTIFLGNFWPFLSYGDFFRKNLAVTHNYIWVPNIMLSFKKIISQSQENLWTDGRADRRRDRQTLFYRTLPTEAGESKNLSSASDWGQYIKSFFKANAGIFSKNSTTQENTTILRLK